MDLGLAGKSAIVCASSKGLGRGCAEALATAGCTVFVNGRNADVLQQTAEEIRAATGGNIVAVQADVSTAEGQRALLSACPQPSILVNNNGGPRRRPFEELTRENMIEGVIQNLVTPVELIQAVVNNMVDGQFGRIVNITSLSVKRPIEGLDLSSGARAGLTALLAGVHIKYSHANVTINNLLPGFMDTDRLRTGQKQSAEKTGSTFADVADQQRQMVPAKRFGNPEEFGNICAFLCSQHAGYINGQNILVDGGFYASAF